jgi:hypothetical protein
MRRVLTIAALVLAALTSGAAAQSGYLVGAARVEITPPPFDAVADAAAFPLCPAALFDGPRIFALQEPYRDNDASGFFNYEADVYCDANLNGRYDGLYSAGGIDHMLEWVHDPIYARAFAIGDGTRTVVIVSVEAIGLFENVTKRMRARALELLPPGTPVDVVFSADHNESSPDTIGLYGAPDNGVTGTFSGIDDYYIAFLVERAATAAAQAWTSMVPGRLRITAVAPPADVPTNLSHNFPTTNDDRSPAAIDPKLRILQGVAAAGDAPVFTVLGLSAHNQQVGHAGDGELAGGLRVNRALSGDWPGAFHAALEGQGVGLPVFLVADNGSIEDPAKEPELPGTFEQAAQTGAALGQAVLAALPGATDLPVGAIVADRLELFLPLENNLFAAAGAAGLFGDRQLYTNGQPTGRVGTHVLSEVSVVDVGSDLQLLAHPSESFPALAVGSPWGVEEASCPERPNPRVPAWQARARNRWHIGLANDLVGYLIPAWGWSTMAGVVAGTCFNDDSDVDPQGHQHKLETESVGPTAGNDVANALAALLDQRPDPIAATRLGRFVLPDGSLSRRAAGAIGVRLVRPGSTALDPCEDTFVALPGTGEVGGITPGASGGFIDYDGTAQAAPDVLTRGMWAGAAAAAPDVRYYVDVYPALTVTATCSVCPTCDDGLACNGVETCAVPTGCVAGTPIDCSAFDDQCHTGRCAEPGACAADPAPDGTPCMANGDTCSQADTCQAGFCRAGGGGDTDGDLRCDADDDCPLVPDAGQRDLDGDGAGDPCDDADATLVVRRAVVRADPSATDDAGRTLASGDLAVVPPDAFTAAAGVSVRVRDGATLDVGVTWSAAECRTGSAGGVACRSGDRRSRAKFAPPRAGRVRFAVRLARRPETGPFAPPVRVTVTTGSVDRVGAISSCSSNGARLRCRQ